MQNTAKRGILMKKKSTLGKLNVFLALVLAIVLIANVVVIYTKEVPVAANAETSTSEEADAPVIEALAANTYAGIDFKTNDDVVNYYAEAYNKTKAQTKEYVLDSGETVTWYSMLGEEDLQVKDIMIEGKSNAMINNLVPGIVGGLFTKGSAGLSPSSNRTPAEDVDESNGSLTTCRLKPEDVIATNVKDNGDGTITLQLQPKAFNMSHRGMDAQGNLFNTLGAIDSVVDSISALSWQSGTTAENCLVNYKNGYATVTIDTKTGLITKADYHMEAHISVNHANVAVLKDKSANVLVTYDVHFPASAEYLKTNVKATAK